MEKKERELIHYEIRQNCLIIYISQDLDHHAVDILREQSDRLIDAGNIRHIIFDFTENDFMDSSGIGLIMGRYKKIRPMGGEIFVSNLNCRMQRIFGLFGLNSITERNSKIDMIVNEED